MTNRYFIKLSFNGTRFHGWQIQPNASTVQEEINKALSLLLKENINVVGCGRTDSGVHAHEFYAHFDTPNTYSDLNNLCYKLNHFLSNDIYIHDIYPVDTNLHTRFDAKSRTYHYYISTVKAPFEQETVWYFQRPLNVQKMNQAAHLLLDYKDFTSFSKLHTQTNNNLCELYHAEWIVNQERLTFEITANRFLRNMVRAIVGTLIDIGLEKIDVQEIHHIIQQKDRAKAGFSVPAKGLFLHQVQY